MAEHVRHELARERGFVRASRVQTLAHFLNQWNLPRAASTPELHWIVAGALERVRPRRFDAILGSRGLHTALAALIEELPADAALPHDLAALIRAVREELAARGLALRNERLLAAAALIRRNRPLGPVIFNGFFTLAPAEVEFIEALAERTPITLTLPHARELEGFRPQALPATRRSPERLVFSSATLERETEEIARRILEHAVRGRRFREMGIMLRSRDPYGPALETTLARFGIPYRSYFTDSLAAHPAVAFLSGIVRAGLRDWDHAELVSLLRMPLSGLGATPEGDKLDFEMRERLPARGAIPQIAWEPSDGLKGLTRLITRPVVEAPAERDSIHAWRSTAEALRGFEEIVEQATLFFESKATLTTLWPHIETALAFEPLRVEDRRRDVVHIMDVFEARQWELPVVFVCGLTERNFPQYHREDALIGDALRARWGLSTAAERQREERFLFELAMTRATEQVVLSYARFNEKGEEMIPSFFLPAPAKGRQQPERPPHNIVARTAGAGQKPAPQAKSRALQSVKKLSPSAIESFLQCPFQYFAGRTLRLKPRPPAPRDRMTILLQGQIIHRTLAEWIRAPLLGVHVLNRVFEETCAEQRVPDTYRTEAVRLELLRHFEAFVADASQRAPVAPGWSTRVEEDFKFALNPRLTIRGRIDRLEVSPKNQALVIDYKYSAADKLKRRVEESAAGNLVQGGLYLLAAKRVFKLEAAGMLYCGLKKQVTWEGWELGTSREQLQELMTTSARRAEEVHVAIQSGEVSPRPADLKKCAWCDFRDACRVETITAELSKAAG